jgi:hypothetical protein
MGTISQGQGAEILGVSRSEFLEVLSDHRVSPCQSGAGHDFVGHVDEIRIYSRALGRLADCKPGQRDAVGALLRRRPREKVRRDARSMVADSL